VGGDGREEIDVLVIAPVFDVPSALSYEAACRLLNWCGEYGFSARGLLGPAANWLALWAVLRQARPVLVSYWDHGMPGYLYSGWPPFPLITVENVRVLRGVRAFHTMACHSAERLGRVAVERVGVGAFYGAEDLLLAFFPAPERNYAEDWIDMMLTVPTTLLRRLRADGELTEDAFLEAFHAYAAKCWRYLSLYEEHLGDWPNADWHYHACLTNLLNYELILP